MAGGSPIVSFLFLALFSQVINAEYLFSPVQTNAALDLPDVVGWTPAPTAAPFYRKRQDASSASSQVGPSTCGWVNGNKSLPITCGPAVPYCGLASNISAAGCCTSRTTVSGTTKLAGCEVYTRCVGLNDQCDDDCKSNSLHAFCTSSNRPYCATVIERLFTFSADFTSYGCLASQRADPLTALGSTLNATLTSSNRTSSTSSIAVLTTEPLTTGTRATSAAKSSTAGAARFVFGSSKYSDFSTSSGLTCLSLLGLVSGLFMLYL